MMAGVATSSGNISISFLSLVLLPHPGCPLGLGSPMAPSSSSAPNGPREFTTPRKDRDRDRQPFPQYSQPSPAQMKPSNSSTTVHSHSTSTSSVSSNNLATPTAQITVEALLKQHASSADPKGAALDQVVGERNTLSSQNAQLWKLVEKQRAGYNTILKEFERIRGERDSWKSRALGSSEGNEKGSSSKSDRTPKVTTVELPGSGKQPGKVNGASRSNSSDEYCKHFSGNNTVLTHAFSLSGCTTSPLVTTLAILRPSLVS